MVSVTTKRITRDQIRQAFGNNPRIREVLESLLEDVGTTLPNALSTTEDDVASALMLVDASMAAAVSANSAAARAQRAAETLEALLMTARSNTSTLAALRRDIDELKALVLGA